MPGKFYPGKERLTWLLVDLVLVKAASGEGRDNRTQLNS